MAAVQIVPGVYQASLGMVSVYLLCSADGVTVIDTGIPGSAGKILAALREIGKGPADVRWILLTHLHMDHTGSALALQEATGAQLGMFPLDAELFEQGQAMRAAQPAPGAVNWLVSKMIGSAGPARVAGARVGHLLQDGETLPFTDGLRAIHAPGHTAGHLVFLWPRQGGVLFAGDACSNMTGLGYPFLVEDLAAEQQTLRMLAGLEFECAVFAHGRPMRSEASAAFRKKWGRV